jgi:hypothetical protein
MNYHLICAVNPERKDARAPFLLGSGSPIVWAGERRLCSAGSSFCLSIALLPSVVLWRAALARFWASQNMLGATSAGLSRAF